MPLSKRVCFAAVLVANGKVYVAAFQQETVDNNTRQHFKAGGGLQSALAIYGLK